MTKYIFQPPRNAENLETGFMAFKWKRVVFSTREMGVNVRERGVSPGNSLGWIGVNRGNVERRRVPR